MTTKEIKDIPLIDVLGTYGHLPEYSRKGGKEYWYFSPFRNEKTPSFRVNVEENIWYDFGEGVGGSIIDFVMTYNNCDVNKAFEIIKGERILPIKLQADKIPAFKQSHPVELRSIKSLGNNPALSDYITGRGINLEFAKSYIKEVYYSRNGKNLFTIGMRNDSNGYEVRTSLFKGCIVNKNITTITGGYDTVSVFEGFMDFLSLLTLQGIGTLKSDVIILHSTSCSERAIEKITTKGYAKVYAFLDNDPAGSKAYIKMKSALAAEVKDMRYLYEGYEDINDKLLERKPTH